MPIMAANAQSDARGAAWLLASAVQDCISAPEKASEWQDALNNTYRLLEAFRKNPLFGVRPVRRTQHATNDLEKLTVLPSTERNLADVRDAMEAALVSSFGETPKDEAIRKIEVVLRNVLAPQRFNASAEDKAKAARFFAELLSRLG